MDSYPFDLGPHSFPVTTGSPEARIWFDRGLNWLWGYNHPEAVACFSRAAEADPACAMAHWGVAYASGPNYNMPWWRMGPEARSAAHATAFDATRRACAFRGGITAPEAALVDALPARYPSRTGPEDPAHTRPWNAAFADAMRSAVAAHPGNREIRAVAVEALMNLTPWAMWDIVTGSPAPEAATFEAKRLLEDAFSDDPEAWNHPGLLHLYVHLMEMAPTPELALPQADKLRALVPDLGHLVHMPTHIDIQCGHYENAVRWNEEAIRADMKFYDWGGAFTIYTGYRLHDCHFAIYAAMFLGQIAPARRALDTISATLPEDLLRVSDPPMANYLESYGAFLPHVLVRFGLWDEAIALPLPEDPELYATLTANTLYARGVAHAAKGEISAAETAEVEFLAAKEALPEGRLLHNNRVADLLEIAAHMLRGEILYRKRAFDAAFDALREAIRLEDALAYDEPWGWMQPVRHALGALLLEQGRTDEAERAFREDLGLVPGIPRPQVHPDNVWALRGLHDCLAARGETVEIIHVRQRLALAEARADRPVRAACACAGMATG